MVVNLGERGVAVWNGGHYWNFYNLHGDCVDAISFGWERNNITQQEALQILVDHFDMEREDDLAAEGYLDDVAADADTLVSAGWGTDEDY